MNPVEEIFNYLFLEYVPHYHACYLNRRTGQVARMVWMEDCDKDEAGGHLRDALERVIVNDLNNTYEEDEWMELHVRIVNGN